MGTSGPSSRPSPVEAKRLETTRGAVRDALSAVRNLEQLLGSIRVGPRAIGDVVPDVHAACRPFVAETRELLDAVGKHLDDQACIHHVVDFITPPVADLERGLEDVSGSSMNAKRRLALERIVSGAADQLEAALRVVELLEEAVSGRMLRVSLNELVQECVDRGGDPAQSVEVTLRAADTAGDIEVNPRAAVPLLCAAVSLVARDVDRPHVSVVDGAVIVGKPADGDLVRFKRFPTVPPLVTCAPTAAGATGAHWKSDGTTIEVRWPTL